MRAWLFFVSAVASVALAASHACSPDHQVWAVNKSATASALASAANCSGGVFDVEWVGHVEFPETIYVIDGTVMNITGAGAGAVADGAGSEQFLNVVNATLRMHDLRVQNCATLYSGGAIYAEGSTMSFNGTSWFNNTAGGNGGAVALVSCSEVSWSGENMTWSQNNAGEYGGAVALVSCSEVSWSGENMTWSQNNAGEYGGAVFVWDSSNMSWSGFDMTWSNNTANHAGAVYMQYSSDVSWSGDMMTWSSNTAHGDGGAVGMRLCGDVTWSGEMMTWSYNTALDGDGGAIYMWDGSDVSWSGGMMTWSNNTALNEYGGAVYMSASWGVSWSGDVMTWSNNAAYYPGGAVCIDNSWDVTWSGEMMTWSNNTAAWNGGAVYLSHSLHVSWRGFSMTWSNNNALDRDGGAVYISHSWYVSWSGINTTWSNNTADGDGGSVYMSASSGVSWSGGMMTWSNNTALHGDGGAVYISTSSNVSWNGKMMAWSNNTAYGDEGVFGTSGGGGAVYISTGSSNVSWSGDMMTWSDNTAFGDGGAVGMLSCSNVSWSGGMMTWSDNTALHGDGGAVCISTSSDVSWSGSNMTWSYNTASLNGGAIYAFSSTTSTFNSSLFEGNTASGAGGAVMLSGVATGLEFVQVNFIANSSPRGGAVYSVSSGIETDQGGNQDYPVVYRGCSFADNRASATGGALESIAGLDRIEGTTYERNSAGAGGALRLGGDANVSNCDFTNNSAKEEGPAISNHGVLHLESGLSRFSGNVFWCEYGTYLDGEDGSRYQTVCDGCPGNNGDGIVSVENEDVVPVCVEQLDNTRSEGGDTTIETLELIKGHWRTTKNSDKILSCYNEDACTGGMTDDPAFCQQGYNGSYCSVCSEGYYSSLAFTCNKCMGDGGGIALMVIVGVLVLGAAVGVCTYLVSAETEGARRGVLLRVVNRLPLQSIKIVVVVWQILTQFASVANVTFPDVYQRFLDGVDILNFDALWIPSAGCVVDFDFHDRLLVSTIAPLIALALLATTYLVAKRRNLGSEAALQKVWDASVYLIGHVVVFTSMYTALLGKDVERDRR
eukprot:g5187.t1